MKIILFKCNILPLKQYQETSVECYFQSSVFTSQIVATPSASPVLEATP